MAKIFLNGEAIELPELGSAYNLGDRFSVRTKQGLVTGMAVIKGTKVLVSIDGLVFEFERSGGTKPVEVAHNGEILASMPGLITDVLVSKGDLVQSGQKIVVLEAMKTQQPMHAPFDGEVELVGVTKGDQVQEGQLLIKILKAKPHE